MAKDRDNIRIYGDDDSAVLVAPKGSTLPDDLAAPDVAFKEVGWLGEDGIDFDREESLNEFTAHQGGAIVRSKRTSVKDTFKFICLEETAITMGLYYVGVVPTNADDVDHYAITNQAKSDERAWVVDNVDGDITKRAVVPRGEVTGRSTVSHKNADLTMYEFTVTIYGDYDIYKTEPSA